jgi:HEPN domain-containing protein
MSEPSNYQAWVARAEEDYVLCRSALRRKVPLLYGATFHAQQCAEKYLKALLVAHGHAFPRTHDLVALHDLCMQAALPVRMEADQLDRLNAYAVQMRYPGDDPTLRRVAIESVHYLGDEGGIACGLKRPDGKEAVIASLTYLRVEGGHPITQDVRAYQIKRTAG